MTITTPLEDGCFYHIYNRGNNGDVIFKEKSNYTCFLTLLKKYILPRADIYAYCLLNNHFHLLVKIRDAGANELNKSSKPEQNFSNFFNAYARTFNRNNQRTGKLFEERFKRKKIEDEFYFTELLYYIHSNSQKHKLVEDFRSYPFSSYQTILSSKETALKREEVLNWFGGKQLFEKYHADKQHTLAETNAAMSTPPPRRC
jgi:hypothetical protein